jgi:hypothetical protein
MSNPPTLPLLEQIGIVVLTRDGDVVDPKGGVRGVISSKQKY